MRLVLASASPRRADLLRAAGLDFDVLPVHADETILPGEVPEQYVRRLAVVKAELAAHAAGPDAIVVGADTAVVASGAILGKPRDEVDASDMLRRLSGRAHRVLTGVAVRAGTRQEVAIETTTVRFAPLSDAEIGWYVATGEPADKAGAYGIQGFASRFVESVEGSYTNVVGLPVPLVVRLLTLVGGGALLGRPPRP